VQTKALPATRLPRLGRLHTVPGCRKELALIYAQARAGAVSWEDAARAADVLRLIASLVAAGTAAESDHGGGT
jgi:hypothetical protein